MCLIFDAKCFCTSLLVEIADTSIGKFYKKEFFAHDNAVLKIAQEKTKMTLEAEKLRKSLNHEKIAKLHHIYTEKESSTRN